MKIIPFLISTLLLISCSNFYEFSNPTEEKEMYRAFEMPVGEETLEFNAYKDYYHDTINLDVVYINAKELNQLKRSTIHSSKNKQTLFLHNDTPYYLNIIGYYYPDLLLNEIKKPKTRFKSIPLTSGLGYQYEFNEKQIADFYIPHSGGILRFMAIGNPEWNKINSERFDKEINFVFYVINAQYFRLKP